MTAISGLQGAASTNQTANTSSGKPASVDYNSFLQLLVAQLKNQDPTSPMDSTAYMSQLASFSQVEQSIASNSKLDSLLSATALQTADRALGRTVTSADGSVSGQVASVQITSAGPVATLSNGSTLVLGAGVTLS
ncbi:MAG: flagellar basal body rod modification protein [Rhizobiales bacterium 24-66-13]|jgi:flagellar basal-body rod modification protein FlgD|uniref:flagellar hook assembly protein FlgD n=1 Tax=Roseixanthobacter finlandensis TaxID=3119922 RepID=UPI000BC847EF|nr:MAG: flagellar basal body rod modification protein [Rhizobiales bacterium 12-66-7]OYZ66273.1 MAG: flagellar basal body rod modification protein [Rhizobiales bacterium 24-66-13]OZB04212.1 MAG: flagellar basal body rod modification protein [Rhizobiales bacterium 39-66-18]HQS09390.1 flagellar hook assembly protein FlgD [Xanthobacteraceae bacterium]HQS46327.1 flagellar hook assembly protein FlgD [Xanthobacteraceae bacterium]